MTPNEIKIMAGGGRCIIQDENGNYLHFHGRTPMLLPARKGAHVWDYVKDNVPGQVAAVNDSTPHTWQAVSAEGE